MSDDRRNDLGNKIAWIVFVAIISTLLGMFFNFTYSMSIKAMDKSMQNSEDIIKLTQCYADIKEKISDIRSIQVEHLKVSQANNVEIQKLLEFLKKK